MLAFRLVVRLVHRRLQRGNQRPLCPARAKQRQAVDHPVDRPFKVAIQRPVGVGAGIREDHQRRLQPLCSVDRHHPHGIARRACIADNIGLATVEPVEKLLQRCNPFALELQRRIEQFVDRVACFLAQPREQFPSTLQRPRQQVFEESVGRDIVRRAQHIAERIARTG